ncbi:hypothetical protein [Caldimonas brevitalea]|uniref:Uncharacterized protein n=1 Tax=Caldimonas brevitalea TaxID=413882 RepID=A0A0G3BKW6_9BURK|nr:hypothetical protein [Caldimonas brevitalea]AKJ30042.1 hypothetical protein AAW51_3351 [Caldimonas brevitalea]
MDNKQGQQQLDQAFDTLQAESPERVARLIRWLRSPGSRWVRLPLGLLFILSSFAWFLPVVGIEFLPVGLLLLAQDIPFLRKPAARFLLWLEHKWLSFRHRRRERKRHRNS